MSDKKSSWSAVFVRYTKIKGSLLHRRMNFRNLSNAEGIIISQKFTLDESPELQVIGHLTLGEIVHFYAEPDFSKIKFCYPHGERE